MPGDYAQMKVFTTCPVTAMEEPQAGVRRLRDVARWSEAAGCEGILVFSDNRQLDPWLVSQAIIEATNRLCPLVAVQPAYMHPYTVAKTISSLAFLYGRRVHLNMVAGGFKNDLLALNDPTPHDDRYARLVEYTSLILQLLRTTGPVTFEGRYYNVTNLKLTPALPPELLPGVLVSGSSQAGSDAARELGATAVEYPKPAAECSSGPRSKNGASSGIRVGLIVRERDSDAWRVARERYPEDRKGQLTRELATSVSDSVWHRELAGRANSATPTESPYWLVPFENYKAMCPYLVGSYERVADELALYVESGYKTFILDEPRTAEDMQHIGVVFERAFARCATAA